MLAYGGTAAANGSADAVRRREEVALNAIVMTGGASCSLTAYAPDTPRAGRKATRRARCSGLAPALSRLRGTYALTRSGDGLASAESVPEDVAAHCLRSTCVPLRVVRLVDASNVIGDAATQRQAARGRAGTRPQLRRGRPGNVA